MKVYMMMFVLMFCAGCMTSSITQIDMGKTDKRDVHQKIFDEMDEMFDAFTKVK